MKRNIKELSVDVIGEPNRPLTKEEQLEISAFIQKMKLERASKKKRVSRKDEKQHV